MEQSKVFNFDPDAIQVMQDIEFEQLPEAVNREIVKNSEEIVFEEEEEISPRNFNRNSNYNSFAINNRSFRESGRNTTNQAIASREHSMRDPLANEKQQKSLKQFNRNNPFMIDERRSFRELRKKAVDNVNIRILESQKSFKETRKYLAVPLDHANGRPVFHRRFNYDLLRQGKGDYLMQHCNDNIRIENEKTLKRLSSDGLAEIVIQRKLCSNDLRLPISPVSDLSPESGFCEGSPQSNHTEPRLYTRRIKYIDEVLGRENSSSSESNLSQKNVDNPKECAKDYTVEISNCKRNDVPEEDSENTIVLHSSPSCKNISDDNNIPIKKDKDIDDSKLSIIEEQSTRGKDNIQSVNETRKADSSLNIDTSYKCVVENDLEEFDNTSAIKEPFINNNRIITKMQNNEFLEHDISSENLVTKLI